MGGNTIKYDGYDLRKYGPKDIDLFIDIGANIGTVSVMARILFPFSRIYAFEPSEKNFDMLKSNTKYWSIACHNVALGPGSPMCMIPHSQNGMHRFVDKDESLWWPEKIHQMSESWTMSHIIDKCQIGAASRYIFKVDCEGGERYLLKQTDSIELIKYSVQTNIEIHMPFGGNGKEWKKFLKIFCSTHDLYLGKWNIIQEKEIKEYVYEPCSYDEFPRRGRVTVELCRR
jgi:FkbM family methyltransferase